VFGRERVGLTNDELQKCHYHVAIPANPDYSSLNLAMAVQILCYEIRMAYLAQSANALPEAFSDQDVDDSPVVEDMERFYQHLQRIMYLLLILFLVHKP
jgi:tRNA (cytidine32/uridine32-2'-O)-methyltransferase